MNFESLHTFILFAAGIFSISRAVQGKSIEASDNPRLSKNTSRAIYAVTGVVLLFLGILRLQ